MAHFSVRDLIVKNRHSDSGPAAVALRFGDQAWTFGELDDAVNRVAAGLAARGFRRGDRLGILMYNRPEYVEMFFAVAHLGGVVVPLNYFLKAPEVQKAIEEAGITWLAVEEELRPTLEPIRDFTTHRVEMLRVGASESAPDSYEALRFRTHPPVEPVLNSHEDVFLLQFSSGTTGVPKAAIHTHGNVLMNALAQVAEFQISKADTYLVIPALCWGAGFHDLTLGTWWRGGSVVLNPSRGFSAAQLAKTIRDKRVSMVLLVPTVMSLVLAEQGVRDDDLRSLRLILSGGEPVPVESIERLQKRLPDCRTVQAYGLSEFPVITTFLDGKDALERRGSAGRASIGTLVRVVDESGEDVAAGSEGEIISKSVSTMVGYTSPPTNGGTRVVDGWLHTGDRARIDADGFLYICGRAKDMIISGGLNVYPAEVERVLNLQDGVVESAVIGVPDVRYGETGLAVVVVDRACTSVDSRSLRNSLSDQLGTFKIPRHWVVRADPLPRTTSGKVQKYLLRQELSSHGESCTCLLEIVKEPS